MKHLSSSKKENYIKLATMMNLLDSLRQNAEEGESWQLNTVLIRCKLKVLHFSRIRTRHTLIGIFTKTQTHVFATHLKLGNLCMPK